MQFAGTVVLACVVFVTLVGSEPRKSRNKDWNYLTPVPKGWVDTMWSNETTDEPLPKSDQEDYDFLFSNKSAEMYIADSDENVLKKVNLVDYSTFRGRKGLLPDGEVRYSDKKKKGTVFFDKKSSKSKHAFLDKFSDESLNVTSDDYPSVEVSHFTEKEESDSPDEDPKDRYSTDKEYVEERSVSDSGFTEVDYSVVEDYAGKRMKHDYTGEISSAESYSEKDSSEPKTSKQKKRKSFIDKKISKKKRIMKQKLDTLRRNRERLQKQLPRMDRKSGRLKVEGKIKRADKEEYKRKYKADKKKPGRKNKGRKDKGRKYTGDSDKIDGDLSGKDKSEKDKDASVKVEKEMDEGDRGRGDRDRGGRGRGDRGRGGRDRGGRSRGDRGRGGRDRRGRDRGRGGRDRGRGGRDRGGRGRGGVKEEDRGFEERDTFSSSSRESDISMTREYTLKQATRKVDDKSVSREEQRSKSFRRNDLRDMKPRNRGKSRYGPNSKRRKYSDSGVYTDKDFARGRRDKAKNAFERKAIEEKRKLRRDKMKKRRTKMRTERRKMNKFMKRDKDFKNKKKRRKKKF